MNKAFDHGLKEYVMVVMGNGAEEKKGKGRDMNVE